jgi:hypothetical protein
VQRRGDPTHTPDRDRLPGVVADGRGAPVGASVRVALRSSVRGDVADQRDEPSPWGAERLAAGRLEAEAVLLRLGGVLADLAALAVPAALTRRGEAPNTF